LETMEDLLTSKVWTNPVRDVWSVEQPGLSVSESGEGRICEGRVLVVSHYLPYCVKVISEESALPSSSAISRRSSSSTSLLPSSPQMPAASLAHDRSLSSAAPGHGQLGPPSSVPGPEQVQAQLSGLAQVPGRQVPSLPVLGIPAATGSSPGSTASGAGAQAGLVIDLGAKRGSFGTTPSSVGRSGSYLWTIRPTQNGNIGLFNAINSVQDRMEKVYIGECECEVPRAIQDDLSEE